VLHTNILWTNFIWFPPDCKNKLNGTNDPQRARLMTRTADSLSALEVPSQPWSRGNSAATIRLSKADKISAVQERYRLQENALPSKAPRCRLGRTRRAGHSTSARRGSAAVCTLRCSCNRASTPTPLLYWNAQMRAKVREVYLYGRVVPIDHESDEKGHERGICHLRLQLGRLRPLIIY
jgi:hypothetical protein